MSFGETEPSEIRGGGAASALAPGNQVTFDRRELDRILGLYGRKVAAGEWRDYAIDFLKDRAVFSVFRRSSEVPDLPHREKSPPGAPPGRLQRGLGDRPDRPARPRARSRAARARQGAEPGRGVIGELASVQGCRARRPGPSARCISTLSSQRSNLKPTFSMRADQAEAERAVQLDRGGLRRIADHRDHLAKAAALALRRSGGSSSARPMPRRCASGSM